MRVSKPELYKIPGVIFALLQIFTFASAKDVESVVSVDNERRTATIEGRFGEDSDIRNRRNFVFAKAVAGDADLAKRISDLKVFDASGSPIEIRKLIDGEYLAGSDAVRWSYTLDLSPGRVWAAAAHRSWIGGDAGILMTDDLLPQFGEDASFALDIRLPTGWTALSALAAEGSTSVGRDTSQGVVFIGKAIRRAAGVSSTEVAIGGAFSFKDDEAAEFTDQIVAAYTSVFGSAPPQRPLVVIMRFPGDVPPGSWEAETRGRTVTIMSSDMAFSSQSSQRLHEQLRHELFHLWIPNGIELKGQYAWFYEGFALYQSLKTAVGMNRITFGNMLDTLSRAYAIDSRQQPRKPLATKASVAGSTHTADYARGLIVAFLADLRKMKRSGGKSNSSSILRELYRGHSAGSPSTDANTAISGILNDEELLDRYVYGVETFANNDDLAFAGLQLTGDGGSQRLSVVTKPNGRQRRILDELGYNSWRNSPRRPKR
jgi:hypothetical protein